MCLLWRDAVPCCLPWLTLIAGALVPESPGELRGAGGEKLNKHYMSGVFTLRAAVSVLLFICSTITLRPRGTPRGRTEWGRAPHNAKLKSDGTPCHIPSIS